jgi:hypothetical protein
MAGPGPAVAGGVSVLVATASVAVWELVLPRTGVAYQIAGGVLVALLLFGAWLLAGFVRRHGDEIGEARFDTRNKDERDR